MENYSRLKPKINKIESLLGLTFIVPYMEIGVIRNFLDYRSDIIVIPASIFIMLSITIVLLLQMKFRQNKIITISKINSIALVLFTLILIIGITVDNFSVFFSQFLWFVVPFLYAVIVMKFINCYDLSPLNIGKAGLICFALYICVNILINFQQYGFALSGTMEQSRILSPGGGPVVLGYTIALVMSYCLIIKDEMSRVYFFFISVILVSGSILTGSRGSIWPMLFLLITTNLINNRKKQQFLTIILLIAGIIIIDPVSLLEELIPRVMDLSGKARTETVINAIKVFVEQPILFQLFGTGLGGFFPYQEWLISGGENVFLDYNMFLYNREILLVQPHNSYVYLLLETGVVGLILFLFIFINAFKKIKCQETNRTYKLIFFVLIVSLNYLDSVFIIQPGSSGLWWLLLFLVVYDNNRLSNN